MAHDSRQRSLFEDLEPPERRHRARPAGPPRPDSRPAVPPRAAIPPRPAQPAARSSAIARTALAVPARCEVPAGLVLRLADRDADLHRFVRALDRHLPSRLDRVTLTDNRSRFLSARPSRGRLFGRSRLALRLHWGFALAPGAVLGEVAAFLAERGERRRQALETLRGYFQEFQEPGVRQRSRRRLALDPYGEHHDLIALRDQVNQRYFGGRLEVPITWGREPGRQRQRSIHLGTYDFERNLIRIHRRLDHPKVPRLVVASVVHHELLHAAMPAETVRGRRRLHPPEFRRREQAFARQREAQEWIRANLPWLLRATGPR
jgi:hypothetical protein